MAFAFKDIEGIDPELATTLDADNLIQTAISSYVATSSENRKTVAVADIKAKLNTMGAKLEAAEARLAGVADISADELKALRLSADKNPELQATLDAMKKKSDDASAAFEAQSVKMQELQVSQVLTQSINQFNTENPTVAVKADMADVVTMLAANALRFDPESGTVRVHNTNGDIIATDSGAATPVDWLKTLRSERPSLFTTPTGSGASGSTQSGGADRKTFTRADYDAMTPEQRNSIGASHTFTD